MSEYFLSKSKGRELDEISVYHAPEADGNSLVIPSRIIRARGRLSIVGALMGWEGKRVRSSNLQGQVEIIEPVKVDEVLGELHGFLDAHVPDSPLEVSDDLPEDFKKVLVGQIREELQEIIGILGLNLPGPVEDDRPYPGMYL